MTRTALPRPTLLPGLARLWRDRYTLQLGLDPARAVLLEVADPAAARLLDLMDGTRSERAILEQAAKIRVPRDDARALIDTLRGAGLVVGARSLLPDDLPEPARRRLSGEAAAIALRGSDAPGTPAQVLRRRAMARVVVTGHGRLAAPVAIALAQSGVGHVSPDLTGEVTPVDTVGPWLTPADLNRPRAAAVAEAIVRVAPGTETRTVRRGRASIVIQVGLDRPAELIATGYAQRRQAHLLLGMRDGTAIVGPLVPAAGSPCLNCLDLHRQDRDPGWPGIAAQLATGSTSEPCATPTLISAIGYAAGEVLAFLDGCPPETIGGATEISAPGQVRRRAWPPHPGCSCARPKRQGKPVSGASTIANPASTAAPSPASPPPPTHGA